ncbi:MAG: PRD domain-containing protein, partial [Clostridiaceae bacterium]|nr:PRD domain-containing protein [Clostridiaceae bacterium]
MKIIKVLNNNLALAEDDQGNEVIVGGKAIGYDGKIGEKIKEEKIQKIYVLDNKNDTKEYVKLIENTPQKYIDITQKIIKDANEILQGKLHDQIFIILIDHINFAIQRYNEHVVIQNRLLWEVKKFYHKEFSIGKDSVDYINKTLGIQLPEEEAGNIAFHLVNAQSDERDMNSIVREVKMVKDILAIV